MSLNLSLLLFLLLLLSLINLAGQGPCIVLLLDQLCTFCVHFLKGTFVKITTFQLTSKFHSKRCLQYLIIVLMFFVQLIITVVFTIMAI